MTYAIIKVAGKQYRVREGERLLVDRLREDEGATFAPTVLLVGGNGGAQLDPGDGLVTATLDPSQPFSLYQALSHAHLKSIGVRSRRAPRSTELDGHQGSNQDHERNREAGGRSGD